MICGFGTVARGFLMNTHTHTHTVIHGKQSDGTTTLTQGKSLFARRRSSSPGEGHVESVLSDSEPGKPYTGLVCGHTSPKRLSCRRLGSYYCRRPLTRTSLLLCPRITPPAWPWRVQGKVTSWSSSFSSWKAIWLE